MASRIFVARVESAVPERGSWRMHVRTVAVFRGDAPTSRDVRGGYDQDTDTGEGMQSSCDVLSHPEPGTLLAFVEDRETRNLSYCAPVFHVRDHHLDPCSPEGLRAAGAPAPRAAGCASCSVGASSGSGPAGLASLVWTMWWWRRRRRSAP